MQTVLTAFEISGKMHRLTLIAVLLILATPIGRAAELESQCVKEGTEVELQCQLEGYRDGDFINWHMSDGEYELDWDYDYVDYRTVLHNATRTTSTGYDVQEITCFFRDPYFNHAVLIVTDEHSPTLPIFPTLQKGNNQTLNLVWENPSTSFEDSNDVYYNYTIKMNVADGYQITLSHIVEAHNTLSVVSLELWGHECKQVNISISLPGNCKDKKISGSLLITPQQFQQNVTSETLFLENGDWKQVLINFIPPELCPSQDASYMLSFNDGNEMWSTESEAISNSSHPVHVYIEEGIGSGLKRDKNYTLNVTVVTAYGNASSTTTFSTYSSLGVGQLSNLMIIGYDQSIVTVGWLNPRLATSSFTYTITASHVSSGKNIESIIMAFLREQDPFVSIDLDSYECENVEITVAVYGEEDEALSVEAVLPSYSTNFVQDVRVDTSLNKDNTIKEAEVLFTPPFVCKFQRSSYVLTVSDGNKTWSNTRDPVVIIDPREPVEVELKSGFVVDTDYTATVTVLTEYANITSHASFRVQLPPVTVTGSISSANTGISSAMVGGIVGGVVLLLVVVLLCGFGAGVVVVYLLRHRKKKSQSQMDNAVRGCMVTNPIYAGSEGFYEELPENLPSSEHLSASTPATSASVPPNIPPPRKTDPFETPNLSESKKEAKINGPRPSSLDNLSSCGFDETEDCYTVMSPAGTLTVLPRNRHSTASLGSGAPWPMGGAL